jgi:hypothetical protein
MSLAEGWRNTCLPRAVAVQKAVSLTQQPRNFRAACDGAPDCEGQQLLHWDRRVIICIKEKLPEESRYGGTEPDDPAFGSDRGLQAASRYCREGLRMDGSRRSAGRQPSASRMKFPLGSDTSIDPEASSAKTLVRARFGQMGA